MKISAIPTSSAGTPGQSLTPTSNSAFSPERKAAAKAILAGETPIQVTKSDTPVDPQIERAQASIRKIKMRTNASPERFESALEAPEEKSAISDPIEQATATTEETKPLSPQLAALRKQQRALQVKEREVAEREKALESKSASPGAEDLIAKLKSQPLSVLQEYGVTYDQLTEAILANQSGVTPEIQELRAQVKALEEGVEKKLSDRDSQAEQQVLAEMRREAEALVKEGDDYEMVRGTNSLDDAMDLILRTYKASGEVLDVSEALRLCEEDLINESLKVAKFKKVQSRLQPTPQPTQQPQTKQLRTLTNRDNAAPILDRKSRAMAAFYGKK